MTITINGVVINNYKSYADDKKFIVVKKIDGEWWFEGADNNEDWAYRAYEDCLHYADAAEIIRIE